jgi:hypothetical protein
MAGVIRDRGCLRDPAGRGDTDPGCGMDDIVDQ